MEIGNPTTAGTSEREINTYATNNAATHVYLMLLKEHHLVCLKCCTFHIEIPYSKLKCKNVNSISLTPRWRTVHVQVFPLLN